MPYAVSTTSSITNASMPDLRKVTIASIGVQTIGSLSLKEVLTTTGTPVMALKAEISMANELIRNMSTKWQPEKYHDDYREALEKLIEELAADQDPIRPLIFHVTFNVQNLPRVQFQLGKTAVRPYEVEAALAKNDLSTFVSDTGGPLLYGIVYNADIFDEETIDRLFQDLAALLQRIVQNPRQRLTELAMLHRR